MLRRKSGMLCNGAPFRDWPILALINEARVRLEGLGDGNRQMVRILSATLDMRVRSVKCQMTIAWPPAAREIDDFGFAGVTPARPIRRPKAVIDRRPPHARNSLRTPATRRSPVPSCSNPWRL